MQPAESLSAMDRAVKRGAMDEAVRLAGQALAAGIRHPMPFTLRSHWHEANGRFAEALADMNSAAALAPGNPGILNSTGRILTSLGRAEEALAPLDEAIRRAPGLAAAHYNRAFALEQLGDLPGACASYEQAEALAPDTTDAQSRLALLAARRNDFATARDLARRALAQRPGDPTALFALALAALAARDFAAAECHARDAAASPRATAEQRAHALTYLGDALDGQARAAEAFAAWQESKTVQAPLFHLRAHGLEPGADMADRLTRALEATNAADWTRSSEGDAPLFILGFPRSGTTLLGQILGAHPQVALLEEKELVRDAAQRQLQPDGVAALAALSADERARYRAAFVARARAAGWTADRLLLDQSAYNTLYLPAIAALFPGARVIFALRDPRDVVLGCYRRLFLANALSREFLSLERAALFYDRAMRLAEAARARLPLTFHDVRNEELVADFEGTAKALCAFAGLSWDPAVARFAERARSRAIATPSAVQVARGINADSVGRWRAYRDALAPVLPQLAPWAARFGYADG